MPKNMKSVFTIYHNHSHPLECVENLAFKKQTSETKNIFLSYFEAGHDTPTSARKYHEHVLQTECTVNG